MKAEADKTRSSKSRAVASTTTVRQDKEKSEGPLADKRPETVAQREYAGQADNSPQARKVAQLQAMANGTFVETVQRQGPEEEELVQGKFETVQRQGPEEEELVQGKFETVQRQGPEEEELLQGKFETVQRQGPEEEELLQGKFETVQKVEEEEELLQGKFETVQKAEEEEELLQGKFETVQKAETIDEIQSKSSVTQKKDAQTPNNTGLPNMLKSGIENLSGLSMDDVKVHYNSAKPGQLQAHAFAQGTDIHMAPGQEQHLPHEAWHVVQQKQGRVKPTMQVRDGVAVNDDQGLESEADLMGAKAVTAGVAQKKKNNDMPGSPINHRQLSAELNSLDRDAVQREVSLRCGETLQGKLTTVQFLGDFDGGEKSCLQLSAQSILQRQLNIESESGEYKYGFGSDFKRDHIGGTKEDAISVLRARWKESGLDTPVTSITLLDGNYEAIELQKLSGYDFTISIDVDGFTAYWNERNKPVSLAVGSVNLSGYSKPWGGLITHISSSA